ncbi:MULTISPECIES: hypothetical protein [unclassified Okeania]|uniref:hypothetical protein n=1 Tax=unclassified Okeania TaxID=2634635 RepID=UPI00137530C2|nr:MULTISPECIES: hypothetical protein [unclassified Okeania]NET15279.1 hypothetical protein [Okeania sp. SIO1H6]NET20164.1 hypothetical protein [Okeania sp. SIO1H5]NET76817.1 hypothetical protein [Okeania sp. SIO1F9]NET92174.1 hypothetical protein [Okeania sp. SIO1H2]
MRCNAPSTKVSLSPTFHIKSGETVIDWLSQEESGVRRRENHFDERSYDDLRIFLCPIKRI